MDSISLFLGKEQLKGGFLFISGSEWLVITIYFETARVYSHSGDYFNENNEKRIGVND